MIISRSTQNYKLVHFIIISRSAQNYKLVHFDYFQEHSKL